MKTLPNDPINFTPYDRHSHSDTGLTKREMFAAMAMKGLLSNSSLDILEAKELAADCCLFADALIAQLNATQETI